MRKLASVNMCFAWAQGKLRFSFAVENLQTTIEWKKENILKFSLQRSFVQHGSKIFSNCPCAHLCEENCQNFIYKQSENWVELNGICENSKEFDSSKNNILFRQIVQDTVRLNGTSFWIIEFSSNVRPQNCIVNLDFERRHNKLIGSFSSFILLKTVRRLDTSRTQLNK